MHEVGSASQAKHVYHFLTQGPQEFVCDGIKPCSIVSDCVDVVQQFQYASIPVNFYLLPVSVVRRWLVRNINDVIMVPFSNKV